MLLMADHDERVVPLHSIKLLAGQLAWAFGDLLRTLWRPGGTAIAPRAFKSTLACFALQFSGYNQHDSQEFLSFLLDCLHEDLNRVKDKPYKEDNNADGRPDDEVADEYWQNHLSRNDSIIVDSFQTTCGIGSQSPTTPSTTCKHSRRSKSFPQNYGVHRPILAFSLRSVVHQ